MKLRLPVLAHAVGLALVLAGCAHRHPGGSTPTMLGVPPLEGAVTVDGDLDEPCYASEPLVQGFVVAGQPGRRPAATRAWLFWLDEGLVFAFDCDDATPVAAPESGNEREVDPQDRVELFLWSGNEADQYFCIEVAAQGAVHEYAARFYRQFDDRWSPLEWECDARPRPGGYRVEVALSRAALEKMGFPWRSGARLRAGLFRADFAPGKPDAPDWITWVDARTTQPDFHVAGAFGMIELLPTQPQKRAKAEGFQSHP